MTFWDTIIMSGAIHGFVLAGIILIRRVRTLASVLLSSLLMVQGLACLITAAFIFQGHSSSFAWINSTEDYFPFFLTFGVGPLIYLHTDSILKSKEALTKKDLIHFLPIVFNLLPPALNVSAMVRPSFPISDEARIRINEFLLSESDYIAWLHITIYLLLSIRLVRRSKSAIFILKSYQEWLRSFLYGFMAFQLIWFPVEMIYLTPYVHVFSNHGLYYYPIYIPLVVLIYWIGIKWLMLTAKYRQPSEQKAVNPLNSHQMDLQIQRLKQLMQSQNLYRNPDLKLADLSRQLNIAPQTLSFLLNNHLRTNFNKFVNEYRIEEAISNIQSDDMKKKTLEGLSMEVGFKSRSSFYRSFKAITGQHPRQYLKSEE
ncbi:MAG: AraC family transcriptional regulator [Cytophagales bacterium]|nr:AraC family transcriptional regulator [Cytophagales bacterium]